MESEVVSAVFFSRASDKAIGSFHYTLGLVEFNISDEALELVSKLRTVERRGRDDQTLVRLAYEAASYLHEMRHFVDTFGTLAGLSLFSARLDLLKDFSALCLALQQSNVRWLETPVTWARDPQGLKEVRDLVRRAQAFELGSEIYIAPFEPIEVEGHAEELHREFKNERGGTLDATPLRYLRVGADGVQLPRTVWYPLGLETLIEGNAHAISRTFVEHYFPEPIGAMLERRILTQAAQDVQGGTDQRAAQTATPYMAVDVLISRFLRRHGIERFPRDLVLTLIDRVLCTSSIAVKESQAGHTEMHVDRVGVKLVNLLESEPQENLGAGALEPTPEVTRLYKSLLAEFDRGGDWQSVEDDRLPLSSIAIWESYLAKTYIVPLLRERLSSDHRAFTTYDGFIELLAKIGLPPARAVNGRLILTGMPERVQQAWWHQLMLSNIMQQVMRSSDPAMCPRASGIVPGIATMNLAFQGDCSRHLLLGCGTYQRGQPAVRTPKCLFEDTLRVCGFER
jgi:hypothetical protein